MSTAAGLLVMMGVKVKPKMKAGEIISTIIKAINKFEPVLIAESDWSAWDKDDTDSKHEMGKPLITGMLQFPKKEDGSYHHIVRNKKGVEFVAKLKIIKWLGKPGVKKEVETIPQVVGGKVNSLVKPMTAIKPKVVEVVEEIPVVEENNSSFQFDEDGEVVLESPFL